MSPIEELLTKVTDLVATVKAEQSTTIEEARKALNEAGVTAARKRVMESLAEIEEAQSVVRQCQDVERAARTALDAATAEAEWELDARFVVESNKTWLVTPSEQDGGEPERKAMTADERKSYKSIEALKMPKVIAADKDQRSAQGELDAAKDRAARSDRLFSACKADLQASIATVQLLATALGA